MPEKIMSIAELEKAVRVFNLRFSVPQHEALALSAEANGRSLHGEIIYRLFNEKDRKVVQYWSELLERQVTIPED